MLLLIDTSEYSGVRFALIADPGIGQEGWPKEFRRELAYNENFKTLTLLEKFLRSNKVAAKDLQKIAVCSGPGSFTGIRVGIALAQAVGFALNIPVVAIPKEKIPDDNLEKLWRFKPTKKLTLHYGREPNITIPKKDKNKRARQK